jgi:type II secretory pathway predicted ATPase ExeA
MMSEEKKRNLSVELRPQRLSELIGQESLVEQIRNSMKDRYPIAILLSGESGAGKSTIAKILALSVQCSHGTFGEPCEECMENELLFNIIERNCADLGTIDSMRELLPGLEYYPSFGNYRVIILDEAHGIGPKAQEVLLLPAEDPNSRNLFILCTTNPAKILDTIKRRCVSYMVPSLKDDDTIRLVANTINKAGADKPAAPLANALIAAKINSPGIIVMAVEKYVAGAPPEEAIIVKDVSAVNHYALAKACSFGKWSECQEILSRAVPADADIIKRHLSAHFRKILLDPKNSPARLKFAAAAVHELSANNAATVYEQGFQLSVLTASIYKICQMVQTAIAAQKGWQLPSFDGVTKQPTIQ